MPEDKDESLITHIEELRKTLIKCFVSIGIILPFVFYFSPKILDFLIKILVGNNSIIFNYFSPIEVFLLQIKLSFVVSLLLDFPYIAKQLWNYILPALYEHERKFISSTVIISSILFLLGVVFCLFVILPLIINFGLSFASDNIHAVFGISNIVNLCLWLSLTFGLMFQVPLITYSLIQANIISYKSVSDKRPYVVVFLLIFAALLTPPDIISQLLLFIPTYILFECGLIFSKKSDVEVTNE
jgi:sec-independent protein translocase protein TatC